MKIRIIPNPEESGPGYELKRVQTGQGTRTANSDLVSLNPASNLLHQIHFDHLYSTSGGNIVLDPAQKEGKLFNSSGTTPKIYSKKYKNDNNLPSPISVQGKHSHTNKIGATDSPKKTKQDDDGDMFSLDADSIQQVFQSMINLTSLTSMADPTAERADVPDTNGDNEHVKRDEQKLSDDKNKNKKINKVKIVDAIPSTSKAGALLRNEVQDKIENEPKVKTTNKNDSGDDIAAEKDRSTKELTSHNMSKTTATGKTTKSKSKLVKDKVHKTKSNEIGSNECKSIGNKEMMELNKELEHERELNMMLKYTTELMVRRWGEYLTMSTEQIRLFEIENALDFEMIQDVVDMLEDNERYVWELIDDLKFF